jgi:hypothetical protein
MLFQERRTGSWLEAQVQEPKAASMAEDTQVDMDTVAEVPLIFSLRLTASIKG